MGDISAGGLQPTALYLQLRWYVAQTHFSPFAQSVTRLKCPTWPAPPRYACPLPLDLPRPWRRTHSCNFSPGQFLRWAGLAKRRRWQIAALLSQEKMERQTFGGVGKASCKFFYLLFFFNFKSVYLPALSILMSVCPQPTCLSSPISPLRSTVIAIWHYDCVVPEKGEVVISAKRRQLLCCIKIFSCHAA